jgi:hypothetical protein
VCCSQSLSCWHYFGATRKAEQSILIGVLDVSDAPISLFLVRRTTQTSKQANSHCSCGRPLLADFSYGGLWLLRFADSCRPFELDLFTYCGMEFPTFPTILTRSLSEMPRRFLSAKSTLVRTGHGPLIRMARFSPEKLIAIKVCSFLFSALRPPASLNFSRSLSGDEQQMNGERQHASPTQAFTPRGSSLSYARNITG